MYILSKIFHWLISEFQAAMELDLSQYDRDDLHYPDAL